MATDNNYSHWSKFNVDDELQKLSDMEAREDREKARNSVFVEKSKLELELCESSEEAAEMLSAQAAVTALKARQKSNTKTSPNPISSDPLQDKAKLSIQKSEIIAKILAQRKSGESFIQDKAYTRGIECFENGLRNVDELLKIVPELQQLELASTVNTNAKHCTDDHGKCKEDDDHHHEHHDHDHHCTHDHDVPPKPKELSLPSKDDFEGVIHMFQRDLFGGLAECHFGLKQYALASEAYKKVLMEDPQSTRAWIGRGDCFDKMNAPLLSYLHYHQVVIKNPTHDDAIDALDLAKTRIEMSIGQSSDEKDEIEQKKFIYMTISDTESVTQASLRAIQLYFRESTVIMTEGLYRTAHRKFTVLLDHLTRLAANTASRPDIQHVLELLQYSCWMNRAGCCLEMEQDLTEALQDCVEATQLQPLNFETYVRKAKVHSKCWQFAQAKSAYERALGLCPNNSPELKQDIMQLLDKATFDHSQYHDLDD